MIAESSPVEGADAAIRSQKFAQSARTARLKSKIEGGQGAAAAGFFRLGEGGCAACSALNHTWGLILVLYCEGLGLGWAVLQSVSVNDREWFLNIEGEEE